MKSTVRAWQSNQIYSDDIRKWGIRKRDQEHDVGDTFIVDEMRVEIDLYYASRSASGLNGMVGGWCGTGIWHEVT